MFKPVDNPAFTYRLNEPIQYMGEPITELAFRKPISLDLQKVGNPVKINKYADPITIDLDDAKFMLMMSYLTGPISPTTPQGLPVSGTLDRMASNDFATICMALQNFFIPVMQRPEPESTT